MLFKQDYLTCAQAIRRHQIGVDIFLAVLHIFLIPHAAILFFNVSLMETVEKSLGVFLDKALLNKISILPFRRFFKEDCFTHSFINLN